MLNSFSRVELNRFRKYLLSPYLNDQPDTLRLFDLLDELLRKEASIETLSKTETWKVLYPKRSYDDAHLRRLNSDLVQLALRFKVAESRALDPLSDFLTLQKSLEEPSLQKHLNAVEKQLKRMFDEQEQRSAESYLAEFQMHNQMFNRASKVVSTAGYVDKLVPADFYLECFYLTQKLKFYISWLQFSGVRTTEKNVPLMPGFWSYLEEERFRDVPLIAVFKKVVVCFSNQEKEALFQDFLHDLEKNARYLTDEYLRECYHMAQNYCALKINQGRTEYYVVYFNLQKKLTQLNLLLENGGLSEAVFKNMITIGLRVGEFSWTEQFINDYYPFLPAGIRENARTFNLANLYSHQKQHGKVIELLSNVEYSDLVYALGAKLILLRTYYELNERLALDSLMDSFRIYIRRNKQMSKSLKREYSNFLNFLSKLSSIRDSKAALVQLVRKNILENQHVISKKWLLEKTDELAKK
ncbi:MAG: hypothetical protein JNJ57_14150 [Saprospiraceae bacterium]|nr:hypothetical protein [Saprospiraceae bacterium]